MKFLTKEEHKEKERIYKDFLMSSEYSDPPISEEKADDFISKMKYPAFAVVRDFDDVWEEFNNYDFDYNYDDDYDENSEFFEFVENNYFEFTDKKTGEKFYIEIEKLNE